MRSHHALLCFPIIGHLFLAVLLATGCSSGTNNPVQFSTAKAGKKKIQGQNQKPKEFTSQDGQFKVLIPPDGEKFEDKVTIAKTTMKELGWRYKSGAILIDFAPTKLDPKTASDGPRIQTQIDQLRDGALKLLSAEMKTEKALKSGKGIVGRKIVAKGEEDKFRLRIYVGNRRIIILVAEGTESWVSSKEIDNFFQSFQFAK